MSNYQVMPDLTAEEYAELKSDIAERGVMVPIEFDEHGNTLDGHHRLKICKELGITDYPKVIRAGMTETEKRTHARKLNMARRQLNREQIAEITKQQILETPHLSDRQITKELGGLVSNPTVSKYRKELEQSGEVLNFNTSTGSDGKQYPRQVERKHSTDSNVLMAENRAYLEDDDLYNKPETDEYEVKQAEYALDEVLSEHPVLSDLYRIEERVEQGETPKDVVSDVKKRPHISYNSGNNEWYTPKEFIDAARNAMGSIDLDPASNDIANQVVQAEKYYTAETNGLDKDWNGNVWMNPPYASDLIEKFIDKLIEQTEAGNVNQAVVLVNNATETGWFSKLVHISSAVCFPKSRVKFYMPDGKTGAPLQGQAVLYVGNEPRNFVDAFKDLGWGCFPEWIIPTKTEERYSTENEQNR